MFRRSTRLQQTGYYTEEGSPSVSYKEKLFKVFHRKRYFDRGDQRNSTNHSDSANQHDFTPDWHRLDDPHDASNHRDNIREDRDTTAATSGTRAHESQTTGTWTQTSTSGTQTTTTTTTTTATQTEPKRKNVKTARRSSLNIISRFVLLLALVFGFTYTYMQMRELQQEVQSLRQQIHTFFPLSDTLPNFALKSQGASVQASLSSDTYWPHSIWILDRFFYWWHTTNKQANVIQGDSSLRPGDCWPLSGNRGHLFITLSQPASVTHVTLGHVTKSQSPTGFIKSAPREFSVYGMTTTDDKGTYLGTLVYDQDGSAFQTFQLTNPDETVFKHVKLQINSNWGNLDNTCLYSFRVHGFTYTYMQMRELQQEVQSLRQQIHTFFPSSDTLPNFALKSQGGSVQASLSSDTYWPHGVWILDRLFYWWHTTNKQANVIQGDSLLRPGDCWPLSGNHGHLFITLSQPASVTHVTLRHITKSQSRVPVMVAC